MNYKSAIQRWAPLPLRLIVGFGFMEHGYAKLARGPEHFIAILHAIGVPMPALMGWATILVELIGGFAVFIGAFVAVTAGGAQFGQPGYETDLLYLACLLSLVLSGSGPFSVDGRRSRSA